MSYDTFLTRLGEHYFSFQGSFVHTEYMQREKKKKNKKQKGSQQFLSSGHVEVILQLCSIYSLRTPYKVDIQTMSRDFRFIRIPFIPQNRACLPFLPPPFGAWTCTM